jgi:hypothetical protein
MAQYPLSRLNFEQNLFRQVEKEPCRLHRKRLTIILQSMLDGRSHFSLAIGRHYGVFRCLSLTTTYRLPSTIIIALLE